MIQFLLTFSFFICEMTSLIAFIVWVKVMKVMVFRTRDRNGDLADLSSVQWVSGIYIACYMVQGI